MTRPRLSYFDLRGRAEAIRLMLLVAKIDFDDHRVVDAHVWAELKPALPFGGLPLYRDGALEMSQSHAILRHLAREAGLLGRDTDTDAQLDATQEFPSEAQEDLWRFAWKRDYPDKMDRYAAENLSFRLGALQQWLRRDGRTSDCFVGETPTHVDFVAFAYLDEIDAFFPEALTSFPGLAEFRRRIEGLPGVDAYIRSGRRSFVFGMGILGPKVDRGRPIPDGARFHGPWADPILLSRVLTREGPPG